MSDRSDWKGRRLGPYLIGDRIPGIPEEEGQLHAAHHVDTGQPVLVVMPGTGDDWRTRAAWSTETTSLTGPSALILHPKRTAGTPLPSLHELTLGYIRIAGTLALLDGREDIRAHFECELQPLPARRRTARWALASTAVLLAAGLALLLWPRVSAPPRLCEPIDDSPAFASRQDVASAPIAYPMPEKPLKGQATPPCLPETEVEVRGACWIRHERRAPCPRGTAEYEGRCFVAVKKPDPQPNSVKPSSPPSPTAPGQ